MGRHWNIPKTKVNSTLQPQSYSPLPCDTSGTTLFYNVLYVLRYQFTYTHLSYQLDVFNKKYSKVINMDKQDKEHTITNVEKVGSGAWGNN